MKYTFIPNRVQHNKMLISYPCLTSITNLTYVWYGKGTDYETLFF